VQSSGVEIYDYKHIIIEHEYKDRPIKYSRHIKYVGYNVFLLSRMLMLAGV
jgi:hypothetical protein